MHNHSSAGVIAPEVPVILVARGCLAPYFLSWWLEQANPLHTLNWSRWRWLESGNMPQWIGDAPPPGPVILFDRNTTTGQTIRRLSGWLQERGYQPVAVGHVDATTCRFGIRYLDYVWDDRDRFDRLGLSGGSANGVSIVEREAYLRSRQVSGAYTLVTLDMCAPPGNCELPWRCVPAGVSLRAQPLSGPEQSALYIGAQDWRQAMLLSYIERKPLLLFSDTQPADYGIRDIEAVIAALGGPAGGQGDR